MMLDESQMDRVAVEAECRSNIYSFLSTVFGREPTAELIQLVREREIEKILSKLGFDLSLDTEDKPDEELAEDLTLAYTRLFLGPGPHISPHESVQRKDEIKEGLFWGDSTVDVKQFIEWLGLRYSPDYKGIPDHIAVEFELMQKLIEREKKAWLDRDVESARTCLEYERRFTKEHLLEWIPDFCNSVLQESRTGFYGQVARLTKDYLSSEGEHIEKQLAACSNRIDTFHKEE